MPGPCARAGPWRPWLAFELASVGPGNVSLHEGIGGGVASGLEGRPGGPSKLWALQGWCVRVGETIKTYPCIRYSMTTLIRPHHELSIRPSSGHPIIRYITPAYIRYLTTTFQHINPSMTSITPSYQITLHPSGRPPPLKGPLPCSRE